MLKRKKMWAITFLSIFALLLTATSVLAANNSMPGTDPDNVIADAEAAAVCSGNCSSQVLSTTSAEPYNQQSKVKDYFFKMTEEQVKLRNELLAKNPKISEGELLTQVAPEAAKYLPADFIARLNKAKASVYSEKEPVTYLHTVLGPFEPGWSGQRKAFINEKGEIFFGTLIQKETEEIQPEKSGAKGSAHIEAECTISAYVYIPPSTIISYELGGIETDGWWSWNDTQVTGVWSKDCMAWTDEDNCWFIDDGPDLTSGSCSPPCDYCYWYGDFDYKKTEDCQENGVVSHSGGLEAGLWVEGDGWWYCWYDDWGGPTGIFGKMIEYDPESGWYQE